ncbi:MAG: glucosylceramidase [Clostridia bacterium]|nr:glucosylceramidase [Clostridia bacterium]
MKVTVYLTDSEKKRLSCDGSYPMEYVNTDVIESVNHYGDVEQSLLNIHDDLEHQHIWGIGGAFSEAAAVAWQRMSPKNRDRFIRAYFDREEGIGYNFGRLTIGSCDFSTEDYTYVAEGDETLDTFDISHDCQAVFPMVKAATEHSDLLLFASPWSPPAYMKTSGNRIAGGHLKRDYYPLWAEHFARYIDAAEAENVRIWGVTLQNEPRHTQTWESCAYSVEEEIDFLGFLGKALEGKNVKIFCYDHCRERTYERSKIIYESKNGKYCDGIAHHWYSGDHFGEVKAATQRYPDKLSIASEGCFVMSENGINKENELPFAERYAHDILGCFRNGVHAYCDWNLTLDENHGPYHNRTGFVDALVYCNATEDRLIFRLGYYYVGHISKFVARNATVISFSSYTEDLDTCAFKNPDGTVVVVVMNPTNIEKKLILRKDGCIYRTELAPHSIATYIINNGE